ncbi:MAG: hypothetical protein JO289_13760 [Xanthobacteraceae bacterium]|nr:hypothetical protein [Xanthobacteraceae bacterium]
MSDNTPEEVAYKLLMAVGNAEKKNAPALSAADREWILDAYAECLDAVKGKRVDYPKPAPKQR